MQIMLSFCENGSQLSMVYPGFSNSGCASKNIEFGLFFFINKPDWLKKWLDNYIALKKYIYWVSLNIYLSPF